MRSFASILHSKQFTFLIGVDEIPITVHSGAIAALSPPLERLVNGPFKEAQENVAKFPDIEVADFENICAVAYGAELLVPIREVRKLSASEVNIKEDFWILSPRINGPDSILIRDNKLTAHVLRATIGDLNKLPGIPPKKGADALYKNTVTDYHLCKLLDDDDANTNDKRGLDETHDKEDTETADNSTSTTKFRSFWNQDVSGVLMGYARIYLFAEKFLVAKLQKDAEAGLRKFLASLDVYRPTRSSVVELLHYVYNDECVPNRADGEAMHPLREMVVQFVALHLAAFWDFPAHRELLRREGDYALDLQDVVWGWLL